ncbi:unnamed protein product [Hymenolepis diminuta]|uniref:Uncharacterized protein n=1 Tax=Hymenolepis diminuta TaxID=6216 RepID=A0A564Y190_HYMDI|nr:unnamed protein product [Hymenolepis diminuta]
MFKNSSTEIKVLSAKIEVKMSSDIPDTSTIIASQNSSKNSTYSVVVPVFPMIHPHVFQIPELGNSGVFV